MVTHAATKNTRRITAAKAPSSDDMGGVQLSISTTILIVKMRMNTKRIVVIRSRFRNAAPWANVLTEFSQRPSRSAMTS